MLNNHETACITRDEAKWVEQHPTSAPTVLAYFLDNPFRFLCHKQMDKLLIRIFFLGGKGGREGGRGGIYVYLLGFFLRNFLKIKF